uniref:Uncharacterized protein MANES_17G011900 n=1 Tax=Rhizophora mucronata TaxID=61149 RepID=A0A2P2KJH8_RHIMU
MVPIIVWVNIGTRGWHILVIADMVARLLFVYHIYCLWLLHNVNANI